MNKIWIIIGVAALLVVGIGLVSCKAHHWGHKMHGGKMLTWMAEKASKKLDLDDNQKVKLDALVQKYQPRFEEVREKHREAGEILIVEFKKDTFSRKAFESLMNDKKTDIHELAFEFLSEFHAILTPEQREKATEHMKKHMERHKKWHK